MHVISTYPDNAKHQAMVRPAGYQTMSLPRTVVDRGTDPDKYGPWKFDVDLKLETDSPMFPTERSKVRYTLAQLGLPIFTTMRTLVAETPSIPPNELMKEVEHFTDVATQRRDARRELQHISQRPYEKVNVYYHHISSWGSDGLSDHRIVITRASADAATRKSSTTFMRISPFSSWNSNSCLLTPSRNRGASYFSTTTKQVTFANYEGESKHHRAEQEKADYASDLEIFRQCQTGNRGTSYFSRQEPSKQITHLQIMKDNLNTIVRNKKRQVMPVIPIYSDKWKSTLMKMRAQGRAG